MLEPLLASADEFWIPLCAVGAIGIIAGTAQSVFKTRAQERSRREIAAYIAEGSMTPEQGEKLMAAGKPEEE